MTMSWRTGAEEDRDMVDGRRTGDSRTRRMADERGTAAVRSGSDRRQTGKRRTGLTGVDDETLVQVDHPSKTRVSSAISNDRCEITSLQSS